MSINTNYFVAGAVVNNKLYWTERDDGGLCFYDFQKDITMYEIDFKPVEFSSVIASKDDYLLGVSQSGRWFWKYNINNKVKETYEINCENYALDWIVSSKIVGDNLVIIPSRAAYVIWINIESVTVEIKDLSGKNIMPYEGIRYLDEKVMVGQNEENNICTLCCKDKTGIIVEQDKRVERLDYPVDLGEIVDYFVSNDVTYAINEEGCVFVCDNTNMKWSMLLSDFEGYSRLFCYNDGLWIFPRGKGAIVHIDSIGKRKLYKYPEDTIWREDILKEYSFYSNNYYRIDDKNKVIFTPFGCNYMVVFDKEKDDINFVNYVKFNQDNLIDLFKKNYGIYYEGNKSLEYYISYIEKIC